MKIAIIGSRNYHYYEECEAVTLSVIKKEGLDLDLVEIVSGLANGADTLGENFAKTHKLMFHPFPAQWDKFGKGAGHIRNKEMAKVSDIVIAFWDGNSKGTANMIKTSHSLGCKVWVYNYTQKKLVKLKGEIQ